MATDINATNTAQDGIPVVPSDGADLVSPCRGLLINAGGTLKVNTVSGGASNPRTYPAVPAGLFPIAVTKVFNTGTSCTGIIGLI